MTHIDDDTLALLADNGDINVAARAHVDGCNTCRARVARFVQLQESLAAHTPLVSVVADVEARLQRPSPWRLPAVASAVGAAFVALIVVRAGGDEHSGFRARGAGQHTELLLVADGIVVDEVGARVSAHASLRADLVHPDPRARHVVVGVDGSGSVHWLRPAYVDATRPPPCPPTAVEERVVGDETVVLPLVPGALELRLYALDADAACDVVALDAALTAGTQPDNLRLVQQQRVVVTP